MDFGWSSHQIIEWRTLSRSSSILDSQSLVFPSRNPPTSSNKRRVFLSTTNWSAAVSRCSNERMSGSLWSRDTFYFEDYLQSTGVIRWLVEIGRGRPGGVFSTNFREMGWKWAELGESEFWNFSEIENVQTFVTFWVFVLLRWIWLHFEGNFFNF